MDRSLSRSRRLLLVVGFGVASAMGLASAQAQELCGGVDYPFPYTDVSSVGAAFCPGIMEAYVTGVSKGTTSTTFSPNNTVTRVQMTTFLQRLLDQGLTRASRRAALGQWWTPQINSIQTIPIGGNPHVCAADGEYIWTPTFGGVVQVQASTGTILGTWTSASGSLGVVVAAGKVFVAGYGSPGALYVIDPTQAPGALPSVADLGDFPIGIAFDGTNIWTANNGGSVSIIDAQSYAVTTVTTGLTLPYGIVYDGANIWVVDQGSSTLLKLNASGAVIQSVPVGGGAGLPVFDGANIWVPNQTSNSITVVQASTGEVVATIAADASNLLSFPFGAIFDGERVLVANNGGSSVSVFKASDLSLIGNVSIGAGTIPWGGCSDGINFWVPLPSIGELLRL
jgi:YVTN family beta-propeller protein